MRNRASTHHAQRWAPVLFGPEAAEARAAAQGIVHSLTHELAKRRTASRNWRLVNGLAGMALTIDYARRCGLDVRSSSVPELILEGVRGATGDPDPSMYFGLAGLAWVGEVTGAWDELGDDLAAEFDAQLTDLLSKPFPPHAHSLFYGLAGLGTYALRRARRTGADSTVRVVQRLRECAVTVGSGLTWFTDSRLMPSPGGGSAWLSLGMPQGMLAAICFLASATRAGVSGAADLLRSSASWLHAQRISDRPGGCFPVGVDGEWRLAADRLAWCNGDLPVSLTLLQAGVAASERAWIDTAADVANLAASIPPDGGVECSLCHGSAGIGFAFAFLSNVLRSKELGGAARRWLLDALGRRVPGARFEGYQTFFENPRDPTFTPRWESTGHFLRGAGGVSLALLATCEAVTPEWAGALMLPWTTVAELPEAPL